MLKFAEAEAEIKKANAELALAEDQSEVAKADKAASKKSALVIARFGLEVAQARKTVLVKFTRPRRTKELNLEIAKATADELAKNTAWKREAAKQRTLERQFSDCTIVAPVNGKLVYARRPEAQRGQKMDPPSWIMQGASVDFRQFLFEIIPTPEAKLEQR